MSQAPPSAPLLQNNDLAAMATSDQPAAEKSLQGAPTIFIIDSDGDLDEDDDQGPQGRVLDVNNDAILEYPVQEQTLPSSPGHQSREGRIDTLSPSVRSYTPIQLPCAAPISPDLLNLPPPLTRGHSSTSLTRPPTPETQEDLNNANSSLRWQQILSLPPESRFENINALIRLQTQKCIHRRNHATFRFVTPGTAERLLNRSCLKGLFEGVLEPAKASRFLRQVENLKLQPIILVLIQMEWDRTILQRLETYYAQFSEQENLDEAPPKFPFNVEIACDIFGVARGNIFFTTQNCYSPAILEMHRDAIVPKSTPLPFIWERTLDSGHDGEVMLSKILEGGWKESDGTTRPGHKRIAVKIFKNKHYFRRELRIYSAIQKDHQHGSLTSYLGSLIHGTEHDDKERKGYEEQHDGEHEKERAMDHDTEDGTENSTEEGTENSTEDGTEHDTEYMIFLPLADGNLDTFLTSPGPHWETNLDAITLLGYAADLCGGLKFLHNQLDDLQGRKIEVIHGDIKPQNILVYRKEKKPWRFTDFGFSKIIEDGRDDTSPPFSNGTFNSPEALSEDGRITIASDIWSLAAVLLEVTTYIVGGSHLVKKFRHARKFRDERNHERDRFFQGSGPSARVSENVTTWLQELRQIARERDPNFGKTIDFLLTKLEKEYLLVDEIARREVGAEAARILLFAAANKLKDLDLGATPQKDCQVQAPTKLDAGESAFNPSHDPATVQPAADPSLASAKPIPTATATAKVAFIAKEDPDAIETEDISAHTPEEPNIPSEEGTATETRKVVSPASNKPLPPTPSLLSDRQLTQRFRRLKLRAKRARKWMVSKIKRRAITWTANVWGRPRGDEGEDRN